MLIKKPNLCSDRRQNSFLILLGRNWFGLSFKLVKFWRKKKTQGEQAKLTWFDKISFWGPKNRFELWI